MAWLFFRYIDHPGHICRPSCLRGVIADGHHHGFPGLYGMADPDEIKIKSMEFRFQTS